MSSNEHKIENKSEHLLENMNQYFCQYFNFVIPRKSYESIIDDLKIKRILLDGTYYEIYSLDTFPETVLFMTLNEVGPHLQGSRGFIAVGDSHQGFFPKVMPELSLDEGINGIDEKTLLLLMYIPSHTYFTQHVLILIFPFMKMETADSQPDSYKVYEIAESIYEQIKVKYYSKNEDFTDTLDIKHKDNEYRIAVPPITEGSEYYFTIFHPFLAYFVNDTYSKNISDLSLTETVDTSKKIFIVHGHDIANAKQLKTFLYDLKQNI
ncbi:MAG: hypothetical protein R2685_14060 [Candidatus Nitrosocosmicus sp.]|nr:hypothetical protein [Candidatus Nitrosocosmicus sp.]